MQRRSIKKAFYSGVGLARNSNASGFFFLSALFLLGAVVGAFVGSFSSETIVFDTQVKSTLWDFLGLFWENSRFHLAAVLLSTSFLGVMLLPALSAFRGYLIGCTASAILSSYASGGFLLVVVSIGIPLLVCLPCFFVLSNDAFLHSVRLMSLYRRSGETTRCPKLFSHCLLCLCAIALWTLLQMIILPQLITAII